VQLGRLVGDADAVPGDEGLRVHARPYDVRVARHRSEAGPLRHAQEGGLLVERHPALDAELREDALAVGAEPERAVAQFDVVQREVGGGRHANAWELVTFRAAGANSRRVKRGVYCAVNPPSATISAPVT